MSTLKVNAVQNTTGVEMYLAKAWVNFNGTGTVAIRASGNVSSITDNGTGDYTVNFTNAMADANYSVVAIGGSSSDFGQTTFPYPISTTQAAIKNRITGGSGYDLPFFNVAIFR